MAERRDPPFGDVQLVVQAAVDLELRNRADADADADRGDAPEIALQSRGRILQAVRGVDTALEQHSSRTNRLGVLCNQRTLLGGSPARECQYSEQRQQRDRQSHCFHSSLMTDVCPRQNRLRLSSNSVTGPSLTSDTCIVA